MNNFISWVRVWLIGCMRNIDDSIVVFEEVFDYFDVIIVDKGYLVLMFGNEVRK